LTGVETDRKADASYLAFHLWFIVPPILLLLLTMPRRQTSANRWALGAIPLITLVAVIYTTPWDNALVRMGIWSYGSDRVIGTIGYVPIEEYAFFILLPLLIGLWLYRIRSNVYWAQFERGPLRARLTVAVGALVISSGAVIAALRWESLTYLGFILGWALPVVALQWVWGGGIFAGAARPIAIAVAVPTVYLWVADLIAIGLGIWEISPRYTTGIDPFGLPIEEAIFFLVINVMVVQGLIAVLWVSQHLPERWRATPAKDRMATPP